MSRAPSITSSGLIVFILIAGGLGTPPSSSSGTDSGLDGRTSIARPYLSTKYWNQRWFSCVIPHRFSISIGWGNRLGSLVSDCMSRTSRAISCGDRTTAWTPAAPVPTASSRSTCTSPVARCTTTLTHGPATCPSAAACTTTYPSGTFLAAPSGTPSSTTMPPGRRFGPYCATGPNTSPASCTTTASIVCGNIDSDLVTARSPYAKTFGGGPASCVASYECGVTGPSQESSEWAPTSSTHGRLFATADASTTSPAALTPSGA